MTMTMTKMMMMMIVMMMIVRWMAMTLTGEANEEHGHTADNSEEKTAHSQILKVEHLSWHLSCCCQARAVSLLDVQYQKDYLCCSTIGANILPARSCSPPSSEELVTGKRIAKLTSPKVAKREFEKNVSFHPLPLLSFFACLLEFQFQRRMCVPLPCLPLSASVHHRKLSSDYH